MERGKTVRVERPHASGWADVTIDGVRWVLCHESDGCWYVDEPLDDNTPHDTPEQAMEVFAREIKARHGVEVEWKPSAAELADQAAAAAVRALEERFGPERLVPRKRFDEASRLAMDAVVQFLRTLGMEEEAGRAILESDADGRLSVRWGFR